MAFDPTTATEISAAPKAKKFDPSTVSVPETKEERKPTMLERGKEVGKETVTGGVFGAIAPELLMYGAAPIAAAVAPPAAPYIYGAGQALRGSRLASTLSGAIGGATGETAGQAVESKYGPGVSAETARVLGSVVGPMPFEYLGTKAGGLVGTLAGRFVPGMSTAKTIGQLLQEADVKPTSLTAEQKRFIEQKLKDVRGGQPSLEAQKEISDMLKKGVSKMSEQAQAQATQLEQQAAQLIDQARAAGGRITGEMEQRVSRLQGQFESAADNLRKGAEDKANKILSQSQEQASRIRVTAENQTPSVRQIAEADAKAAIDAGRKQADQIIQQTESRINKLKQTRDSLRSSVPRRMETAKAELAQVGAAQKPTEIGKKIRSGFESAFEKLKNVREANLQKYKTEAFENALVNEASGLRFQQTAAFDNAMKNIQEEVTSPITGLLNVPEGAIRKELNTVYEQLKQPMSFEGLEKLRRSLRDRSFGLPAEGYDAIGQQQAGRLAQQVENIMEEFSPGFRKYLEQYKADSKPLNDFKNSLGKSIVGKEEFDFSQFVTDAAKLGDRVFDTETTVKQLVNTVGAQEAENIARGFVSDKLRNAGSKEVSTFLSNSRDWIGQFPALEKQLNTAVQQLSAAEKVSGKRAKLSDVLRTEMQTLPIKAQTAMSRAEQDAVRAAEARLKAGEREVGKITTAAEREAGAIAGAGETAATKAQTEAERQIAQSAKSVERQRGRLETEAEKLIREQTEAAQAKAGTLTKTADTVRKEAQDKANLILAGTTDAARIKDIILGKDAKVWQETANIILATPGGKEKFGQAVGQVIADEAGKSLKGAITNMKYIGDNLVTSGLMDAKGVQALQSKLEEIFVAPVSLKEKSTFAQRAVRNAIVGYAAPGVARAGQSILGE